MFCSKSARIVAQNIVAQNIVAQRQDYTLL